VVTIRCGPTEGVACGPEVVTIRCGPTEGVACGPAMQRVREGQWRSHRRSLGMLAVLRRECAAGLGDAPCLRSCVTCSQATLSCLPARPTDTVPTVPNLIILLRMPRVQSRAGAVTVSGAKIAPRSRVRSCMSYVPRGTMIDVNLLVTLLLVVLFSTASGDLLPSMIDVILYATWGCPMWIGRERPTTRLHVTCMLCFHSSCQIRS